jgi:chemotaxis protein CheZ
MGTEHDIRQRIGELTRELHDALRALGLDRSLNAAAEALPDARDRLAYVATLTGQAAERVLTAVEEAQAEQTRIAGGATALLARLQPETARAGCDGAACALADPLRAYLGDVTAATTATQERLHAIMMAQDFHDLSGQVIKRVTDVARRVESSLVELLVDTRPVEVPVERETLAGPVIRPSADCVSSQGEVDDLLASLGF